MGIVAELDRREAKRTAERDTRLARTAIVVATVSAGVSPVGIVVQAIKPVVAVSYLGTRPAAISIRHLAISRMHSSSD